MQAWLQAMQARMSSTRPPRALAGMSGSQIMARVMPHHVGLRRWRGCFSASCGWLMRPVTMTGSPSPAFTAAAKGAR